MLRPHWFGALLSVSLVAIPIRAHADDGDTAAPIAFVRDDDEVQLRSGESLRGRIALQRPDGSLVVVLADGASRALAANEVAAIRRAPEQVPAHDEEPETRFASTHAVEGWMPVQFTSPSPWLQVGIEGDPTTMPVGLGYAEVETHHTLCLTPCTLYVPRHTTHRFWSGGLVPDGRSTYMTGPFSLDVRGPNMQVRLRADAPGSRAAGVFLAGFAAIVNGSSIVMLGFGAHSSDGSLALVGGVSFAISAGMLAAGLALAIANRGGIDSIRSRSRDAALLPSVAPLAEGGAIGGLQGRF